MKRILLSLLALLVLGSAGFAQKRTKIVFSPQWTAQAQFAGYYVADSLGFYSEEGLDVTIKHPTKTTSSLSRLADGECNIITMHLMSALRAREEGIDIVNVLQTSQQNALMVVSNTPLYGNPENLRGKTLGTWKVGFDELLRIMDKALNLNIQWVPFAGGVNLFISGAVDAQLVMNYNEFFQLTMAGQRIDEDNLFYMSDITGYNIPEDGLYVTSCYYRTHKASVEKFVKASKKGWQWCLDHPEEALDIVMERVKRHNVGTNKVAQKWMLKTVLHMQEIKETGERPFTLSEETYWHTVKLMTDYGLLTKEAPDYKTFVK